MSELRKRTHVYCQMPQVYEVAGCPNNPDHKFTWSEFEHRLWCFDCEVDFIPSHWGIFDGPIPLNLTMMMGISFDRLNMETGELVPKPDFNDKEASEIYNATWNDKETEDKL